MLEAIKDVFGLEMQIIGEYKPKGYPIYMTAGRAFYKVSYRFGNFIIADIPASERFGVVAFEKQIERFKEKENLDFALHFEMITPAQRKSLISRGIPFIASGDQIFLPFLGIAMKGKIRQEKSVEVEKMMPATQLLFLYMLYQSNEMGVIKKDAADAIGVTRTSITRASEQLLKMGLIVQETVGKETIMKNASPKKDLLKKAIPYMINPVKKRVTVKYREEIASLPLAGESALSAFSMLMEPKIKIVAADKKLLESYKLEIVDERWTDGDDILTVELWKYNPEIFAEGGIVDKVSLAESFENEVDERIIGSVEDMLEEIKW